MLTIQKRDWRRFIPEFYGVRARFDAAREAAKNETERAAVVGDIEFEIHALSAEEQRRAKNIVSGSVRLKRDGTISSPMKAKVEHDLFVENVKVKVALAIEDLDKQTKLELTTAELMWVHAPPELIEELVSAVEDISVLEEGRRD